MDNNINNIQKVFLVHIFCANSIGRVVLGSATRGARSTAERGIAGAGGHGFTRFCTVILVVVAAVLHGFARVF